MEIFSKREDLLCLLKYNKANQYKEGSNQNLLQMVPLSVNYIIFIYKVTYKWFISYGLTSFTKGQPVQMWYLAPKAIKRTTLFPIKGCFLTDKVYILRSKSSDQQCYFTREAPVRTNRQANKLGRRWGESDNDCWRTSKSHRARTMSAWVHFLRRIFIYPPVLPTLRLFFPIAQKSLRSPTMGTLCECSIKSWWRRRTKSMSLDWNSHESTPRIGKIKFTVRRLRRVSGKSKKATACCPSSSHSRRVYMHLRPLPRGWKARPAANWWRRSPKEFSVVGTKKGRKEELQLWEDFFLSHVFQIAFEKNFISLMTWWQFPVVS